jgi:DNA-binding response OmpR family regulator
MRILIAEDDSSLASFVKKGLDAEHYAMDVSSDGEQARSMAGEFDYELVVLDLTKLVASGWCCDSALSSYAQTQHAHHHPDRAYAG